MTMAERLSVVETKVDGIVSDIKDVKDDIKDIKLSFDQMTTNNDKRYAARWVQSAVSLVIGIILSSVVTALVAIVIIPNTHHHTNTTTILTTQNK